MTLGDDPFRKRDAPPQDPGSQPPPYASQPYGAPPQGAQQPYGYPQYGAPYPTYGQQYGQQQYGPVGQPPPGHLGWAITAIIFFWPLAIAAFINYSQVESRWYRGDIMGAQLASAAVKRYGIIALCVGIALGVLWFILVAAVFTTTACTGFNC